MRLFNDLRPPLPGRSPSFRIVSAIDRDDRTASDSSSSENDLNMIFSFVSDPRQLPPRITERRVDGLLLHGERPALDVQMRLQTLPTVWLMANPQRPEWGDQVMPDNSAIGAMAAQYLLRRGHRRLAYLGTASSWSLEIRSLAFAHAATEAGAQVEIIEAPEQHSDDFWQREGLSSAARAIAERLARSGTHPTGLFIAEDRLVVTEAQHQISAVIALADALDLARQEVRPRNDAGPFGQRHPAIARARAVLVVPDVVEALEELGRRRVAGDQVAIIIIAARWARDIHTLLTGNAP